MALFFLWNMMPLCSLVMLWLLIVGIERVIHTTYTLTAKGMLVMAYGRFQRKKEIPLQEIKRVEKWCGLRVGRFCLIEYLLIFYGNEKHITAMPVKEDEFLETLWKKRGK